VHGDLQRPATPRRLTEAVVAAFVSLAVVCPVAGGQAPARTPDIFFAPTLYSVADAMLKMAQVTANDVVYDLGSGDGRVLILELRSTARVASASSSTRNSSSSRGRSHVRERSPTR